MKQVQQSSFGITVNSYEIKKSSQLDLKRVIKPQVVQKTAQSKIVNKPPQSLQKLKNQPSQNKPMQNKSDQSIQSKTQEPTNNLVNSVKLPMSALETQQFQIDYNLYDHSEQLLTRFQRLIFQNFSKKTNDKQKLQQLIREQIQTLDANTQLNALLMNSQLQLTEEEYKKAQNEYKELKQKGLKFMSVKGLNQDSVVITENTKYNEIFNTVCTEQEFYLEVDQMKLDTTIYLQIQDYIHNSNKMIQNTVDDQSCQVSAEDYLL
ncbi:Hypothetical_protein [Hexamita inflata]|uniref:Hypothetical_protein n=1 Tax=Hexamita inflata TaxID=28002 RepID=A0AA86R9T4_9EUKA|nr:Hypothetical protein HINF_LOCUS56304 [Hexamita inflata]